jgi:hypothetical protein
MKVRDIIKLIEGDVGIELKERAVIDNTSIRKSGAE